MALFPLLALTHPALCTLSHLGQLTVFAHKAMKSLCEQTDFFRVVPTSSKVFQLFLYFLLLNLHILEISLSLSLTHSLKVQEFTCKINMGDL